MKHRIIATSILWILIILTAWFLGKWGGLLLVAIFGIGAFIELTGLLQLAGRPLYRHLAIPAFALNLLALILIPPWVLPPMAILAVGLSLTLVVCLLTTGAEAFPSLAVPTLGAMVLLLLPFGAIALILHESGLMLTIWVLAVAKFGDVGALLTGMSIGKHKMAPTFSPNKTWEGFGGGLVASALVSVLLILFFGEWLPAGLTPLHGLWSAVVISASGVLGDLMESAFKRDARVKDSGTMIPGIGGFLDLTDSLILAVPVAYFLIWIIL